MFYLYFPMLTLCCFAAYALSFLGSEVAERTASLVARWQGVGFTHVVLNTDNMSILGLSIDYGPFGFFDAFDPSYTRNTTDLPGLLDEKEAEYAMESLIVTVGVACANTEGKIVFKAWILTSTIASSLTTYTFWACRKDKGYSFLGPFLFSCLVILIVTGFLQ
ncbi:hypothetical protein Droror1_Dr00015818 [Drosera rotundifolia]